MKNLWLFITMSFDILLMRLYHRLANFFIDQAIAIGEYYDQTRS